MVKKTTVTYQNKYFKKFLINVASLLLFFVLYSCNKDEIEREDIKSSFEIKIDNDQFKFTNASVHAIENCERLSVGVQSDKSAKENFTIVINLLKNGGIDDIRLFDYRFNSYPCETPDFNKDGLLTISNFEYDEVKKYLHFEYEGELIKVETDFNSLDKNQPKKKIKGVVTINDIGSIKCDTRQWK